jgi:hypothetical protein
VADAVPSRLTATKRSGGEGMSDQRALTEERAEQIQLEETVIRRPRTPDGSDQEVRFRRSISRDVAMLRDAGIIVDVPAD